MVIQQQQQQQPGTNKNCSPVTTYSLQGGGNKICSPVVAFLAPPKTTSQHVLLPVMVVLVLVLVLVVLVLVVVVVVVVVGGVVVVVVVAAAGVVVVVVVVVLVVVTGQLSLCKTSTKNLDHILETNNCSPAPLLFFGAPPQKVLLSLPPPRDKDCSPVVSFWTPPPEQHIKNIKNGPAQTSVKQVQQVHLLTKPTVAQTFNRIPNLVPLKFQSGNM